MHDVIKKAKLFPVHRKNQNSSSFHPSFRASNAKFGTGTTPEQCSMHEKSKFVSKQTPS